MPVRVHWLTGQPVHWPDPNTEGDFSFRPTNRLAGWPVGRSSGGDPIDQQHGSIHASHSRFRASRQVRAADRPVAIAETNASAAVPQTLLEHDHLANVAVTRAMACERAVQFALLLTTLPPEIEAEHGTREEYEPRHGRYRQPYRTYSVPAARCRNDEGIHTLNRRERPGLYRMPRPQARGLRKM